MWTMDVERLWGKDKAEAFKTGSDYLSPILAADWKNSANLSPEKGRGGVEMSVTVTIGVIHGRPASRCGQTRSTVVWRGEQSTVNGIMEVSRPY